jgi:amino acid transporter
MSQTNEEMRIRPKRNLTVWGALGLSLGIVGPSLAMSGNGQGTAAAVGKAVPLIFVLGGICVLLISHGYIRLTQYYNQAGAAYALVGKTLGPRAGYFAGWGTMIAYFMFAVGNVGAVGTFVNAFLANAQNSAHPTQIPWLISGSVALVLCQYMATREFRSVVRTLLFIEATGVACMTILALVIIAKGGNHSGGGLSLSVFSFSGAHISTIMAAVVGALLSWCGFEGAAALGEETNDPKRNIPKALLVCVIGASLLFILVMFAQTVGFGTDAAGVKAFAGSGNSLATLGHQYVGQWFSLVLSFTAIMSSFGCMLGCVGTAGRLLFAFSRDGVGPASWGQLDKRHEPIKAVTAVIAVCFVISVLSFVTGHPQLGLGNSALSDYFYYSTIGAVALLVAYLMVEIGTIRHILVQRRELMREIIIPIVGAAMIIVVFWYNVKGEVNLTGAANIAFAIMLIGLLIGFGTPGSAEKISAGLNRDLGEAGGKEMAVSAGHQADVFPTDEV